MQVTMEGPRGARCSALTSKTVSKIGYAAPRIIAACSGTTSQARQYAHHGRDVRKLQLQGSQSCTSARDEVKDPQGQTHSEMENQGKHWRNPEICLAKKEVSDEDFFGVRILQHPERGVVPAVSTCRSAHGLLRVTCNALA